VAIQGALFAVLGTASLVPVPEWLSSAPFSFDWVLQVANSSSFAAEGTLPTTIVAIDDETHREWGKPTTTPRDKLADVLDAVAHKALAAIVVDRVECCAELRAARDR
jgi:CHASE2 domain-containing sensor protein